MGPTEQHWTLSPIAKALDAFMTGAVDATEDVPVGLNSVTYDPAAAVCAGGRKCVNRALEAVEGLGCVSCANLEGFVIVVSADITDGHLFKLPSSGFEADVPFVELPPDRRRPWVLPRLHVDKRPLQGATNWLYGRLSRDQAACGSRLRRRNRPG
jgi:hypothetical protein